MRAVPARRTGRVDRFLDSAAAELARDARGDVLELGLAAVDVDPPRVRRVQRVDAATDLSSVGEVDTIVSVAALAFPHWTPSRLESLTRRLRPGGRVLFVEPVAVAGVSGAVQRVVRPLLRARYGLPFERTVVDELRAVGLVPTSVVRTSIDPVGRVRTFITGVACRR